MAAKFVAVLVAMAVAGQCSVVPVALSSDASSFSYDVADPITGDYKSQVESRAGGAVVGQYSLVDPDGTRRTVDYTADDLNGFNAAVRKDAAVVSAPVVAAAAPAVIAARSWAPSVVARSWAPSVVARSLAPYSYGYPSVYSYNPYSYPLSYY